MSLLKENKRTKLLLLLMLITVLTGPFLLNKIKSIKNTVNQYHKNRETSGIIAVGTKLKHIALDGMRKTSIDEYDYQKLNDSFPNGNQFDYAMNLLKKKDENVYLFPAIWHHGSSTKYLLQKFFIPKTDDLKKKIVYEGELPSISGGFRTFIIDYNFELNKLYTDKGEIVVKKDKWFVKTDNYEDLKFGEPPVTSGNYLGARYLNDDIVVIQDSVEKSGNYSNDLALDYNIIKVYSINQRKIIKERVFGYCPITSIFWTHYEVEKFPMLLDKENEIFYFTARFKPEGSNEGNSSIPLWLCKYDIRKNKTEKIVKIDCAGIYFPFWGLNSISNYSNKSSNLITISTMLTRDVSGKDFHQTTEYCSLIIDVDNKKIIKKWPWGSKSMRWSPDGRYLGILQLSHYFMERIETENSGSLYLYELETDTLKKIDQDETLIDFQWVH